MFLYWNLFSGNKFNLIIREPNSPIEQFKYEKKIISFIIRFFYNFADKIISPSSYIELTLRKKFYINKNKIIKIINPCLNSFEKFRKQKKTKKEILALKPYLLSIGNLTNQKNFIFLIKAFSYFIKIKKNYNLIIIGEGRDKKKLKKLIIYLKLKNKVHFLGKNKSINFFLKNCKYYCCTSLYEGMPNSIIEALNKNKPVISTSFDSGLDDLKKLGFKIKVSNGNYIKYAEDILALKHNKQQNKFIISKLNNNYQKNILNLIND